MMEDDCSLDLVKYWNFTWRDFFSRIPYDWDVVQMQSSVQVISVFVFTRGL